MAGKQYKSYVHCLRGKVPGLAVFYPDDRDLKPGYCGYFDTSGHWKSICNLITLPTQSVPFSPLSERLELTSTGPQDWAPVPGIGVKEITLEGKAETNMPAAAGVALKYMRTKAEGALLMADPVTYHSYGDNSPFREWLKHNRNALVMCDKYRSDILRHGLCIITEAYTTSRCTVSHWDGKNTEISVSVTADALSAPSLKLTGKGAWNKISGGGIWRGFGFGDTRETQQFTVVVGGVKYSPVWYLKAIESVLKSIQPFYQGRSFTLQAESERHLGEARGLGDLTEDSDRILSDSMDEEETEILGA